jgi:DNA helicase-2/ATP-dependent DNA helicase PcrA
MYKDRVSDFVCRLCGASDGKVVRRIEDIYDAIYIDEMQDLSGWDQTFIDLLLESKVQMTLVGDPRQTTYSTTNSLKNRGLAGNKMMIWIKKQEKKDLCICEEKVECFRSNQDICDFADSIYPDLPKTISKSVPDTIHDGIFEITSQDLVQYLENYSPVMLRWDKNTNTFGYQAINIGMSKGKTYERVLVFPTKTMSDFLKNRNPEELKPRTRSKLYVAVTRARYSVAFLTN